MNRDYIKADLILLTVTVIAAAGWIFSKETLIGLPPLLFIGLRFLLGGAVLALAGSLTQKKLSFDAYLKAIATGFLFATAMIFWIQGLAHTDHVGEGAFITSMGIVLVPIIAFLFFSEQPSSETWIALPVASLGLALLSLNRPFSLEAGQLYFLIAAVFFAIHFTAISRLVSRVPPLTLTAIQLSVVGVCSLAFSGLWESWPSSVETEIWLWFLASALIATSLRFWMQTKGQSYAPASHAVLILTLEPVWTALIAGLWFEEKMTVLQLSGCCLIFSALLISRWRWIREALGRTAVATRNPPNITN